MCSLPCWPGLSQSTSPVSALQSCCLFSRTQPANQRAGRDFSGQWGSSRHITKASWSECVVLAASQSVLTFSSDHTTVNTNHGHRDWPGTKHQRLSSGGPGTELWHLEYYVIASSFIKLSSSSSSSLVISSWLMLSSHDWPGQRRLLTLTAGWVLIIDTVSGPLVSRDQWAGVALTAQ